MCSGYWEGCVEYKEEGGVAYEVIEKCFCETNKCRAWGRYTCYVWACARNSARLGSGSKLLDKRAGTSKTQRTKDSINQSKKTNLRKQEHLQV
jgi:hypothetical protein